MNLAVNSKTFLCHLVVIIALWSTSTRRRDSNAARRRIVQTTINRVRNNFLNRTVEVMGPASNDSVRFLVFGDWGGLPFYPYTTVIQRRCAKRIASVARSKRIQFILALGDNFYFHGVKDENDKRFQRTFEEVYHEDSVQVPWYLIAGNHDHDGNVTAQIAYTKKSKRWYFPHYYYMKTFDIPGAEENATLEIYMLDTVLICGRTSGEEDDQPLTETRNQLYYNRQFAWLEKNLNASTAKYILIAGHYPIYSACSHGTTKCLETDLVPLLHKYRVNAYLAGHDHDLQHIRPEPGSKSNWTVEYFVSGCTNFINPSTIHRRTLPKNSLKFVWASMVSYGGLAYMEVTQKEMSLIFYNSLGHVLYEKLMTPRI